MSGRKFLCGCFTLGVIINAAPIAAQQPERVKLATVIATFLADSGVRTRGLPWTTGNNLPIKWATPTAIATEPAARAQGITLSRSGTFLATFGDTVVLPVSIRLGGTAAGLAGATFVLESLEVTNRDGSGYFATREMLDQALRNDGLTLTPLKCSREVEGASYGNLVDAVKAPGKASSGLWWSWQSVQQELNVMLSILYRRTDMNQVECFTG
jgi:hypothetical protein